LKVSNELKIGLTVVVAVLVGFIGFRIMKDVPLFRQGNIVYTVYERVDGLSVGTPVTLRGIKIGSVQSLTLLPTDSVQVALNINFADGGIPIGSIAYVRSVDLLGTKGIEIERSNQPDLIGHQDSIQGVYDEGLMGELAAQGTKISQNVNSSTENLSVVLEEVKMMLQQGGSANISGTLSNLNSTSAEVDALIKETNNDLKQSIESLKNTLQNVENLTSDEQENIKNMLANLEAASDELESISTNLNSITGDLAQIMRKINEGEGTLGLMVNDPNLYNNLDSLTSNMNVLIEQLNENPRHYLRHLKLVRIF
jgi:ABC-type transporter Mla subunit MlaD